MVAVQETDERYALRMEGMAQVAAHVEAVVPGWRSEAIDYLRQYVTSQSQAFLAEDFIRWLSKERPAFIQPDKRAFGTVFRAASKDKIISKVGYTSVGTGNASPKPLWKGIE